MMIEDRGRVYEQPSIRQALGETLRPGGLSLTKHALDFCALLPGVRILDAGCGTGATVEYLQDSGYSATGIDLSAVLLQIGCRRNPILPLVQADGAHIPLPTGEMDAILTECSLSVFTDVSSVLTEFYRLLRPGGYLIISDLYTRNPEGLASLRTLAPASCLCGALCKEDLLTRLAGFGYTLLVWEDHSEELKHIVRQLMAAPEDLTRLQGITTGGELDALDLQLIIARARPGYFLLVAQKL